MLVYASIAAVGAGLHVVALVLEHHAEISATGAMLTVAIPAGVYMLTTNALFSYLIGSTHVHPITLFLKYGLVVLSVILAAIGVALPICVIVLALAPAVGVASEELKHT